MTPEKGIRFVHVADKDGIDRPARLVSTISGPTGLGPPYLLGRVDKPYGIHVHLSCHEVCCEGSSF
jgi:hypothetical protein